MSSGSRRARVSADVEQHHERDARHDRREQEHDRHERRGPPRVRLDRAEDEPDVAVQQERRRDADDGERVADPLVHPRAPRG